MWTTPGAPFNIDVTPPGAPTGLTATGVIGAVNLSWTASGDPDVAGYNVYRGTVTGVYDSTPINGTLVTGMTYGDTTGTADIPYYYVVKAVDTSANVSAASGEATATPLADTTPPAAPTGLAATPYSANVSLSWDANSEIDLAGYNVYRGTTTGGPYSKINSSLVIGAAYVDGGLTNGTPYYYVVRAVDTSTNESGMSNEASATPLESLGAALEFDGVNDYVTFGPNLNASSFTLEAWVKRDAGGVTMTTGTDGLDGISGRPLAYPIVTKGMGEGDGPPANINMNYFLGITSTGVVGADFEDNSGGVNHPAWGSTQVLIGGWHHIAAAYNGSCWALYLDGNLETLNGAVTACPNATPEFSSIQHAGLAAGIGSTGQLSTGFFAGTIDEARIWNVARSLAEIRSTINSEPSSGTGLIGRWGMNEGSGTTIVDSTAPTANGTLTNGPLWVPGAPFNLNLAPDVTNPGNQSDDEGHTISLPIQASDENPGDTLSYSATGLPEGLSISTSTGLIAGTISYHAAANSPCSAVVTVTDDHGGSTPVSITWTVNQAASGLCTGPIAGLVGCWPMEENGGDVVIDATAHGFDGATSGSPGWVTGKVGDRALTLDGTSQYATVPHNADLNPTNLTIAAWIRPVGNTTQDLVKKAGSSQGYELSLSLYNAAAPQKVFVRLNQSDSLRVNSTTQYPTDGASWMHAAATYDGNTIRLYINGIEENSLQTTTPIQPSTVPLTIGADSTGGRKYNGTIDEARVYNRALSLAEIQELAGLRVLSISKTGTGSGTVTSDPGGINCGTTCSYAFAKDTVVTLTATEAIGSTFTGWSGAGCIGIGACVLTMDAAKAVTANFELCYPLTLGHTGQGSDPTATPTSSIGCPAGQYVAGETISLSDATPVTGWYIAGWYGTQNNASTGSTNQVVMPAGTHSAGANYELLPAITSLSLVRAAAATGPWTPVAGDLTAGFIMDLDGSTAFQYLDVRDVVANKTLKDGLYPFTVDQGHLPSGWLSYWAGRGVVEGATGWQGVMWEIIHGRQPLFYLKVDAGSYRLVDGLVYLTGGGEEYLRVDGSYLLGAYRYTGSIADTVGGASDMAVDMAFIGSGVPAAPEAAIAIAPSEQDISLTWPAVDRDAGGKFTVVTKYQVFRSEQPYFDPASITPTETTATEYHHYGAINDLTNYFYIIRAENIIGPSDNSKQLGKFTFQLETGQ
jgi:hypothetical protein